MVKSVKLRGKLKLEANDSVTFMSTIHDGTPFSLTVFNHDYEQNEEFTEDKKVVNGWLYVIQEAQQDKRCYLTLPKPSITYGKQIVVHELQLMPRNASIADFRPQTQGGKTASSQKEVSVVM